MKRFWLLGIFIIFILDIVGFCLFAPRNIDLDKQNNLSAAEILYKTAVNSKPDKEVVSPEDVRAVFVDLNGDGVDEVVGYSRQADDLWIMGTQLFILEKGERGEYKNAGAAVNFFPRGGVKILRHKTNGYHDLKIKSIYLEDTYCSVEDFIIKYDAENRAYYNPQQIKQLADILE